MTILDILSSRNYLIKRSTTWSAIIAGVLLSFLMLIISTRQTSAAAPYLASDVLGQINFNNYRANGETLDSNGLSQPNDTKVDIVNHRLFVSDYSNNRVLIYNLNSDNSFQDSTADYVLGQPDFTNYLNNATINGLSGPKGLTIDSTNNLLYVADSGNNRILVFDVATITNNEDAIYVLGQPDFTSNVSDWPVTAKGFYNPSGISVDSTNNLLYVTDVHRVLVFDVATITNNEDAVYVLGEPDFISSGTDTNAKGFRSPHNLVVDSTNNLLYVSDSFNSRVLVFDVATITNNEDAIYVLGQPDFTSSGQATTSKSLVYPKGLELDPTNNLLYVSDSNGRVLVFDVATITNYEDAIYVLGQPDFSGWQSDTTAKGFYGAFGLAFDPTNNVLFVVDLYNNRVLVFDTATISNNEDATDVIGQIDFVSNYVNGVSVPNAYGITRYGSDPLIDTVHHRLFVSDNDNNRVLVFNLDNDNMLIDKTADYVLGQPDFSTNNAGSDAQSLNEQGGIAYDSVNDRLFVSDRYSNCRIMVYDTTTITNGEAAVNVLGSEDVNASGGCGSVADEIGYDEYGDLVYDETDQLLFVTDLVTSCRVMVFDLSSGITDGMDASHVLGSTDPGSAGDCATTASSMYDYYSGYLALDQTRRLLFVGTPSLNRVLVFNISTITDNEDAVYVLGQPDFTSSASNTTQDGLHEPYGMVFDPDSNYLFVNQYSYNSGRLSVFDTTTLSDGMDAVAVLGAVDFETSGEGGPSQSGFSAFYLGGLTFDSNNRRLYVGDDGNHRVLIFDFANITNTSLVNATNGASYTDTIDYIGTQGTETFAITAGALPPGITLNPSTGVLSGAATTNGTYNFTVTLTDDNGPVGSYKDTQSYVLGVTTDTDGDGVDDSVEEATPLGNDVNNDTIPDNKQAIVTTSYNTVAGAYVTAVVDNCANGFTSFFSEPETDLANQDSGFSYPLGIQSFTADCGTPGATATITQYLDKVYDTSNWTYRKYINNAYIDFSSNITYGTATVNGITVTTVQFSITDGGQFDSDGLENGMITDPLGAAVADGDLANTGVSIQLSIASGIAIILLSTALIPKKNRKYILERL